jgi:hypothetical protein
MNAISVFKKEVINYNPMSYIAWLLGLVGGCFAFLNPPAFIAHIELAGIFYYLKKGIELAWSMAIVFVMGFIGVIATKVATKWWEDRGRLAYEKYFGKKKNKR